MLTPAGINHALKIMGTVDLITVMQHQRIDRFYEQLLFRVLTGPAWNKFKRGQIKELTFTDACGFWSINPRSSGEQYKAARRDLSEAISMAKRHLGEGHSEVTLASRVSISLNDLNNLETLEKELDTRFKDQLNLISRRSVKWGKVTEH
jgi:hypothetical protein